MKAYWPCSLFLASALAQTTTITGNITDPAGDPLSGSCSVQAVGPFKASAGWRVIGAPTVIKFSGGSFSAALAPTDSATPSGQYYKVTCIVPQQTVNGNMVGPYTWGPNYWLVPTNAAAVDISAVELAAPPPASFQIQWQQLSQNGAQVGQAPLWNGASWQPGYPTISSLAWSLLTGVPATFPPSAHASTHGYGGSDAVSLDASQIISGVFNAARIPAQTWASITGKPSAFAPSTHASTHGSGGSDPVSLDASQIGTGIFSSARIPQIAYSNLSGIPSTFNAGQLQGLPVGTVTPNDGNVLTYNLAAGKWTPTAPAAGLSGGNANYLPYWTGPTALGPTSFLHLDNVNKLFYIDNAKGGGVTFGGAGFCCGMYYLQQFTPSSEFGNAILAFNDTNGFQNGQISWNGSQWSMSGIADSDFEANVQPSGQQMMVNANGSGSRSGTLCNSATDVICSQNVLVSYYCYVMPSIVGNGGTMTLIVSWNDGVSNRSFTSAALNLSDTTQVVSGALPVYVGNSKTITWQETWTNAVVGSSGWVSAVCSVKRN